MAGFCIVKRMIKDEKADEKMASSGIGPEDGQADAGFKRGAGNKARKRRRGVSMFMALSLLLGSVGLMGCGGTGDTAINGGSDAGTGMEEGKNSGSEDLDAAAADNAGTGEKVMGRYVESVNDSLDGLLAAGSRIIRQEDGNLGIFSTYSGKWISADNGDTWEQETVEWFNGLKAKNAYILDSAVAKDGSVGVIYGWDGEEEPEEDAEGEPGDDTEGEPDGSGGKPEDGIGGKSGDDGNDVEAESGDNADGSNSSGETAYETEFRPQYMVVSPDGTVTEFEIPYNPSGYLSKLGFSDDGRLFGAALDGKMYEIDWEQGESRLITEIEEGVAYFRVWDGKMVCVTWNGVYLYDLDTGESVTDKALDEFVDTQMKEKLKYADGYYQPLLVIPSKDDVLYLVCEKGIFRHVWGGNLVEQLADGSLNSLSNPSYAIADGLLLEDGTFLIIVSGGILASYTYDPDMPATPDIQMKAYSLTENERLKKAISEYQIEHPEVYIRYETGMGGGTSVTREDALKKLNTEIAAGNGPDFFLLDDMPIDSYVEKGILEDLTPYLAQEMGEGYFQNILKTFGQDGKIPAVPIEFNLLLMSGRGEDVGQMKDLASMAGLAVKYREEKTEGRLFGPAQERTMLRKFFPVCAPAWVGDDGKVKEDVLEDFFVQMKLIWDAEKVGITSEMVKEEEEYYSRMKQEGGRTEEEADVFRINNIINEGSRYMVGEQAFFSGILDGSFDFDVLNSYFHIKGNEDGDFAAYCGQAADVFIPRTIAGISQTSENKEVAAGLMETLIHVKWDGLVLNKEQTKEGLRVNATEDGGSYGSMGGGSIEDGTYVYLDIYPASEEQIEHLIRIAEQAKVPYIQNRVLENAVCEAGEKVLKGSISAREGVQEVVKQISLYMAE